MAAWFLTTLPDLLAVILSTLGIFVTLIVLTRLIGLRSFSKMSSFDFALTVAIGSIIASTILTKSPPLIQAMTALATVYVVQFSVSWLRKRTSWLSRLDDNEPLLLMAGSEMLHDNLEEARVTEDDVWAKLREANVLHPGQVRAVVFETTGDISVLHGDDGGVPLDPRLLTSVRDRERMTSTTGYRAPSSQGDSVQPPWFSRFAAIQSRMTVSSTAMGNSPWASTSSWKARRSKRSPSTSSASVRRRRMVSSPIL